MPDAPTTGRTARSPRVWAALCLVSALLWTLPAAAGQRCEPVLVQAGVIDALLGGGYEGFLPLAKLAGRGDFGLGTFDALDGELVLLDGVVYQVPADGRVRRADMRLATPFAQVTRLCAARPVDLPAGAGLKEIEAALDAALNDPNVFAAARVDARFASLKARSVPRQSPPYRPLAEVAKEQSVFEFGGVEGALVGLRGPAFARGTGVPGWHWHFLTRDRTRGGHVLELALAPDGAPRALLEPLRRFELLLPQKGLAGLDLARDRAQELKAVESGR